jgi:endonuclease-3
MKTVANKTIEVLARLRKTILNPATELHYKTPFELLVAVILSAQSTDVKVNKVTAELFTVANTPQKMVDLGETKLKKHIKSIGLFNTKASNIIKTSKLLVDKYNAKVPSKREDLESLPGVGRKTANVILNVIFKQPVIAVDTHIFRVSNRIPLAIGKNPFEVEEKLTALIPKKYRYDAHHLLVLHGRYTCTAKKPHCDKCVINDLCSYRSPIATKTHASSF